MAAYIIMYIACTVFGFNGGILLSVPILLNFLLSIIYVFMMVFTAVNVNTFHAIY